MDRFEGQYPSANEWASLGEKAARGAGYDWGHAQEFGKALMDLARLGVDGSPAVCDVVSAFMAGDLFQPRQNTDVIQTQNRRGFCPISLGSAMVDLGGWMVSQGTVEIGPILRPILLVPFLADLARSQNTGITVSVGDGVFTLENALLPVLLDLDQASLKLEFVSGASVDMIPATDRLSIDIKEFSMLSDLGMRTTVPATAASRETGAGAGLTDND